VCICHSRWYECFYVASLHINILMAASVFSEFIVHGAEKAESRSLTYWWIFMAFVAGKRKSFKIRAWLKSSREHTDMRIWPADMAQSSWPNSRGRRGHLNWLCNCLNLFVQHFIRPHLRGNGDRRCGVIYRFSHRNSDIKIAAFFRCQIFAPIVCRLSIYENIYSAFAFDVFLALIACRG